jgi:hypothetical protein
MTLPEEVITIFLIALHLRQNSFILIRPPNSFIIIISSQSGPDIYVAAIDQPVLEAFSRAFSSHRASSSSSFLSPIINILGEFNTDLKKCCSSDNLALNSPSG